MNMKKVLFVAMAALAITGCSQNEEFENEMKQTKMDLSTVVGRTSRAADTNNGSFKAFAVSSYITDGGYAGAALGTAYMDDIAYVFGADWTTEDTGTYYWPTIASGKKVQFFAYPNDLISDYAKPETGYPSFTYAVAAVSADQKDIVVAHENDKTTESEGVANGLLTLNFKHILTRVNFAYIPEKTGYTYEITKVEISNVKGGTAKYTFSSTVGAWDLTNATASTKYLYPVTQSTELASGKTHYLLGATDASLMLLPQDLSNAVITVTYSVKQGSESGTEVFNGAKTVTLATGTWAIGKSVLYVLTLPVGATDMGVTPSVGGWEQPETEVPGTGI